MCGGSSVARALCFLETRRLLVLSIHSVNFGPLRLRAMCLALLVFPLHSFAADAGNAFNPKISLILDGNFARYTRDDASPIPGFVLGDDAGLLPSGLSLGETELAIEANVDDIFHAWSTISLSPEGGISIE